MTLRQKIDANLRTDAEFDAFCIDHFPEVHRRFSANMERIYKVNLLLQLIPQPELAACLENYKTDENLPNSPWPTSLLTKRNSPHIQQINSNTNIYTKADDQSNAKYPQRLRVVWIMLSLMTICSLVTMLVKYLSLHTSVPMPVVPSRDPSPPIPAPQKGFIPDIVVTCTEDPSSIIKKNSDASVGTAGTKNKLHRRLLRASPSSSAMLRRSDTRDNPNEPKAPDDYQNTLLPAHY